MKLFGHRIDSDDDKPMGLQEVTIQASPETLLRIADFLQYAARRMQESGSAFGHEHLSDYDRELRIHRADIIAFRA